MLEADSNEDPDTTVVSHLSRHVDLSENVNFSSEGVDLSGVST